MKKEYWIPAAIAAFLLIWWLIALIIRKRRDRFPYERRALLTENEKALYEVLAPVAERMGLLLLIKMRLADIMTVKSTARDYMSAFNRIKAKHTDFLLCDPDTLDVLVGIELDDNSHLRQDRIQRDEFVDGAYLACGIPLLHVWNPVTEEELMTAICNVL